MSSILGTIRALYERGAVLYSQYEAIQKDKVSRRQLRRLARDVIADGAARQATITVAQAKYLQGLDAFAIEAGKLVRDIKKAI